MNWQSLNHTIQRLIIQRRDASVEDQDRINKKLTKLYDLRRVMIEQDPTLLALKGGVK